MSWLPLLHDMLLLGTRRRLTAALGSVTHARSATAWATGDSAFVYSMRNPISATRATTSGAYLTRHGWVASTYGMGGGLMQELQITLALLIVPAA